jgi:hypothetical protein
VYLIRYVLPASLAAIGVVIFIAGDGSETAVEGWALFTGAAAAVLLMNVFFRIGAGGDRDRVREEAAREYFDRHGRWPDQEG